MVDMEEFKQRYTAHGKLLPMSGNKAVDVIAQHFLGKDWYIVDPVRNEQGNIIILEELLLKYPKGNLSTFEYIIYKIKKWINRNIRVKV